MVIQIVKVRSRLADAEVRRIMEERQHQLHQVPGLLQTYYCREGASGDYVGVSLWDSEESIQQYRESKPARGVLEAYQVEGKPRIEVFDVLFALHRGAPAAAGTKPEAGS